jgi:tetratricopeptide (TPR) repeat protein
MNPKASAILEKACEERRRSNFKKAIDRLDEGVEKFPGEFTLYTEAIDVGMEAGESLHAIQIYKKAQHKFPDQGFEVWTFAAEKVGAYNDSIMGRFLVEQAVKTGDLAAAASILENLKDRAVSDLFERIRIKKQTMTVARGAGPSGSCEIASFTLTEALLSLRLGRTQAAMDGFVTALEEDPATAARIEPFLSDSESRGDGKGETAFALGCCLVSRADFSHGLEKLSQAARGVPALVPRVIERIEAIEDSPDLPADIRDLTLAQLYLAQGERTRASRILKGTIERTPGRAADVVDLLRGSVETIDDDLETQFVFVEAAFAARRRETALGQLRKIHKDKRHTTRLVEWLETRAKSQSGSTEVQLFFAETALNEGLFGKAIEIFKEILSRGPQEEAVIRELLSRHQSVAVVRTFYKERFAASREEEKTSEFELERCEGQGFHRRDTVPAAEKEPSVGQSDDGSAPAAESFRTVESLFHQAASAPRAKGEAPSSDFENHDFSLTMHEPAAPVTNGPAPAQTPREERVPRDEASFADVALGAETPAEAPATAEERETAAMEAPTSGDSDGSDFFDYLQRHSENVADTPAGVPEPNTGPVGASTPNTEPAGVAEPNTEPVGASTPNTEPAGVPEPAEARFQDETAVCSESEPAVDDETRRDAIAIGNSDPETHDIAEEDAVPQEDEYRDFDSLYRAYLSGRLDHAQMIEAAGRAFDERRMDEMKLLLSFEPSNLGEDIARKYHLARYYLEEERPLPALVALRAVHLNSLSREERKDFLLRIAECYRALHNFEAAHGMYLRIMTEHADLPEAEALARANYSRYIQTAMGAAAALEKTTTL